MTAGASFVVCIVGSDDNLARLQAASAAASENFVLEHVPPAQIGGIAARAPDVAVIGPDIEKPLPVAREIRQISPQSQILFLMSAERLQPFRATLPFVPNLASAWTADMDATSRSLAVVLSEAARAARNRAASETVLGRVNRKLADRNAQPAEARWSQLALGESYLATILSQIPDAFVAVDRTGSTIAYNEAAVVLLGKQLEAPGANVPDLLAEAESSSVREALRRAASGETLFGIEVNLGKRGQAAPIAELSLAPVQDGSGAIASVSITARDITERKKAEKHQRLLINELNHRVKNTLAIVDALARQSFRGHRPVEEQRAAFSSRLSALAAAHDALTDRSWRTVSLSHIVGSALIACGGKRERTSVEGPEIPLPPKTAVSFALALHELCTNAVKHGALSTDEGRLQIRWIVEGNAGQERLKLDWIESRGPRVEAPTRRGFGLKMLEQGLAAELDGSVSLEFAAEGVVCRIDAPLPGRG